jgi:hypothetical protein
MKVRRSLKFFEKLIFLSLLLVLLHLTESNAQIPKGRFTFSAGYMENKMSKPLQDFASATNLYNGLYKIGYSFRIKNKLFGHAYLGIRQKNYYIHSAQALASIYNSDKKVFENTYKNKYFFNYFSKGIGIEYQIPLCKQVMIIPKSSIEADGIISKRKFVYFSDNVAYRVEFDTYRCDFRWPIIESFYSLEINYLVNKKMAFSIEPFYSINVYKGKVDFSCDLENKNSFGLNLILSVFMYKKEKS